MLDNINNTIMYIMFGIKLADASLYRTVIESLGSSAAIYGYVTYFVFPLPFQTWSNSSLNIDLFN